MRRVALAVVHGSSCATFNQKIPFYSKVAAFVDYNKTIEGSSMFLWMGQDRYFITIGKSLNIGANEDKRTGLRLLETMGTELSLNQHEYFGPLVDFFYVKGRFRGSGERNIEVCADIMEVVRMMLILRCLVPSVSASLCALTDWFTGIPKRGVTRMPPPHYSIG
jgi:hypothetical protein